MAAFRSDLSTFGILTMAKYYVFISFQSRGESPPTLSTTFTCFAGRIRFSYVKIHERERERRGKMSSFENKFNCETNATESFITRPSRNVPVFFFFFLNLIQVSQTWLCICSWNFLTRNLKKNLKEYLKERQTWKQRKTTKFT